MKAINAVYFQDFINNYKTKQEERANKGLGLEYFGPKEMQMLLDRIPTVDAEPVRHGRWIRMDDTFTKWQCSECGSKYHNIQWRFCPDCGAKMDLKE